MGTGNALTEACTIFDRPYMCGHRFMLYVHRKSTCCPLCRKQGLHIMGVAWVAHIAVWVCINGGAGWSSIPYKIGGGTKFPATADPGAVSPLGLAAAVVDGGCV